MTADNTGMKRSDCALCGYSPVELETESYVVCPQCGTLSQAAVPKVLRIDESARLYSHGISWIDTRWLDLIEATGTPGRRLLDLGCGNGAFMDLAVQRGWTAAGVEASAEMVQNARDRGQDVRCADVDQWTADGAYDLVRLWFVLEHIREPGRLLREATRSLAPRGLLVVAVPNDAGWLSRRMMESPDDRFWEHPLHLNHFPPFGLERWLESVGYTLEVAEVGRPAELMRGGSLPLNHVWEETRATNPKLSRLFYQLGIGRSREIVLRRQA